MPKKVFELKSSQEADTQLLLHILHAAESGSTAVMFNAEDSQDTDVLILCLVFSSNIPWSWYQKCSTKNRTCFIDITKLSQALGGGISNVLISMYAFTGCDSVSAFAGCSKITTFKQMKSDILRRLQWSWTFLGAIYKTIPETTDDTLYTWYNVYIVHLASYHL